MKKLKLLSAAMLLLLSMNVNADDIVNSSLNLQNPDVRKCLIESSSNDGWKLQATYLDSNEKLIMVFSKDNETKVYKSK